MKPLLSFLCPTYGRIAREPHLIQEMLYWFTKQTIYPKCELVILNDVPWQTLICSVPGVRVINRSRRYPTLGEKMNALVEFAQADICCVYEDDDISLQHRAEQALEKLSGGFEFWCPRYYYFHQHGQPMIPDRHGVMHNASAYRRHSVIGRYPKTTVSHDSIVQSSCLRDLHCNPYELEAHEISYVYRFGVSDIHLSAFHPRTQEVYDDAETGPAGVYELKPVMGFNYQAEHERLAALGKGQTPASLNPNPVPPPNS